MEVELSGGGWVGVASGWLIGCHKTSLMLFQLKDGVSELASSSVQCRNGFLLGRNVW